MGGYLDRTAFKGKTSSKPTIVGECEVPALGGKVKIAKLSAGGRDRVSSALLSMNAKESGVYRARLVIETACNETGDRLFTETDATWLAALDYDLLEPIVDEANRLNKFDTAEDTEKN